MMQQRPHSSPGQASTGSSASQSGNLCPRAEHSRRRSRRALHLAPLRTKLVHFRAILCPAENQRGRSGACRFFSYCGGGGRPSPRRALSVGW